MSENYDNSYSGVKINYVNFQKWFDLCANSVEQKNENIMITWKLAKQKQNTWRPQQSDVAKFKTKAVWELWCS